MECIPWASPIPVQVPTSLPIGWLKVQDVQHSLCDPHLEWASSGMIWNSWRSILCCSSVMVCLVYFPDRTRGKWYRACGRQPSSPMLTPPLGTSTRTGESLCTPESSGGWAFRWVHAASSPFLAECMLSRNLYSTSIHFWAHFSGTDKLPIHFLI